MASATTSSPTPDARASGYVRELWERRSFSWFLAISELRARNASTTLGLLWWVLNPLLLGLVYFAVFGVVFPSERDIAYLMSGMFAFHFTAKSLSGGANSILRNARLLANLRFPRLILPLSNLIDGAIGFLVSLLVLAVIIIATGGATLTAAFWMLPVVVALHFMFNLGVATLGARLAVPFRDINNFIPYVTRVWLYLSPIIWPLRLIDEFPDPMATLVTANPMWSFLALYRASLLGADFSATHLAAATAWAIALLVVGVTAFVRFEGRMVRYL